MRERIINLVIRLITMAGRFLFMFGLAKYISVHEVGKYGLFSAILSYCFLILGADYYTYTQRKILANVSDYNIYVVNHLKALLLLYAVFLPLFSMTFIFDILETKYLLWFYILIIPEHLSQEIIRMLISIKKQVISSIVLFIRIALWGFVIIALMAYDESYRSLEYVFFTWWIGSVVSVFYGGYYLWGYGRPWVRSSLGSTAKSMMLREGYRVGFALFLSTISARALLTLDRIFVSHYNNSEILGVYVFFIGVAMSIKQVIEPLVIQFTYPNLISTYRNGYYREFITTLRNFTYTIFGIPTIVIGGILVFIPYVLTWIGKPAYSDHIDLLWLSLIAVFIMLVGYIPHYCLYAFGDDKKIIFSHISGVMLFVGATMTIAPYYPKYTVNISAIITYTYLAIYKYMNVHSKIIQIKKRIE